MKLLALALIGLCAWVTWRMFLLNSPVCVPMAVFTLFTIWLYYECTKFTKT